MAGADQFEPSIADVTPGVVQLGVPFDQNWSLSVDGDASDGPPIVRHQHRLRRAPRPGRPNCGTTRPPSRALLDRPAGGVVGRGDLHRLEDPRAARPARQHVRERRDADRAAPRPAATDRGPVAATIDGRPERSGDPRHVGSVDRDPARHPGLDRVARRLRGAVRGRPRRADRVRRPSFSIDAGTWMPHVNSADTLTGSWFCPGRAGDRRGRRRRRGRRVESRTARNSSVASPSSRPTGPARRRASPSRPWSQSTIDVGAMVDGAVRQRRGRTRRRRRDRRAAGDPPCRRIGRPVLERHVRHVVPRRRVHRRRQRRDADPDEPVRRRGDRPAELRHRDRASRHRRRSVGSRSRPAR